MIEINNITKCYGEKEIVRDFSLKIPDGDFIVFSGTSGCGKTTMLNIIGGFEPVNQGTVVVDGISLADSRKKKYLYKNTFGFLFQNFALVEQITVRENLELIHRKCREEISFEEALQKVGLNDCMDTKVYKLSGGEQQRVALARLMIKKCSIVLADEPTGSLDYENAKYVMEILANLNREGKTVIMVTHAGEFLSYANRVVHMNRPNG